MKNINESGRSMVEMLGVLAIIGVLSLGGIAGYTMAMNKVRANDIVSAVVQAAIDCRTRGKISADITADGLAFEADPCTQDSGAVQFHVTSTDEISRMVCKSLAPVAAVGGAAINCSSDNAKADHTMTYVPTS